MSEPSDGTTVRCTVTINRPRAEVYRLWRLDPSLGRLDAGHIEFRDSPAGRGTEVTATVAAEKSLVVLGEWLLKVRPRDPLLRTRQTLRRFKQLLETGEISVAHSPRKRARTHR